MATAKRHREAEAATRDALRGLIEPKDFTITNEERLTMRNIPYFVLPSYETVPKTKHVTARVDTRNTSYKPASKKVSPVSPAPSNKIPSYSHIRSKIDTGRRHSGGGEGHSSTAARSLTSYSRSTPSLGKSGSGIGQFRSVSASQLPPTTASASKYKSVKPRVNSLESIHRSPGGRGSPSRPAQATRQTPRVKLAWESSSTEQKPKTKKFEKVRSKIDQSDPNPAHQLKHSLEELTLDRGREINPRFAEKKEHKKVLQRRHSSLAIQPPNQETPAGLAGKKALRKTKTLGALDLPSTDTTLVQELSKPSSASQEMEETPPSEKAETPHTDERSPTPREHLKDGSVISHTHQNGWELKPAILTNGHTLPIEDESPPAPEDDKFPLPLKDLPSLPEDSFPLPPRDDEFPLPPDDIPSPPENSFPLPPRDDEFPLPPDDIPSPPENSFPLPPEDDLSVTDIEVTHTDTSTTVVLTHLWGQSSLTAGGALSTIDEGEGEGYYEVEDKDNEVAGMSTHTFPHGIPQLCVIDETGQLVDVVVNPTTGEETQRTGQLCEEHSDDLQDDLSELVINSNQDTGFNETSKSTKL